MFQFPVKKLLENKKINNIAEQLGINKSKIVKKQYLLMDVWSIWKSEKEINKDAKILLINPNTLLMLKYLKTIDDIKVKVLLINENKKKRKRANTYKNELGYSLDIVNDINEIENQNYDLIYFFENGLNFTKEEFKKIIDLLSFNKLYFISNNQILFDMFKNNEMNVDKAGMYKNVPDVDKLINIDDTDNIFYSIILPSPEI